MTPGAKTLTAPPAPTGSPALLRAYAQSLRELATTLRRQAATIAAPLPASWRGAAPTAAAATAAGLAAEFRVAAGALDDMAAHVERYATTLAAAVAHHHTWLKRVAEVAGVVLVTAAVVTITVATAGAAAPVVAGLAIEAEAGAAGAAVASGAGAVTAGAAGAGAVTAGAAAETTAGAAVAGMESAAASAASAETSLVGGLAARALPMLRQLGTFVRPQLVGAEVTTGFDAAVHVGKHGSLSPYTVGLDLVENVTVGAGVGEVATRWLVKPGIASRIGRLLSARTVGEDGRPALLRHLSNATTNAAVDVGEDELTGKHDSRTDVGLDFLEGLVGSGVGDVAAAHDVRVARAVNATRNVGLPKLSLDDDGRVLRAHLGTVYRVDPNKIRFSQSSMTNTGVRVSAISGGWRGHPIEAVVMPDGGLTSLDNRRVLAARAHGIQANVKLLDPAGVVPADLLATRFEHYKLLPGATWSDVVHARISRQGSQWRLANPHGQLSLPAKVKVGSVEIVGIRPPRRVDHAL